MSIPQPVIEEIARKADILDIVGEYVQLQKKGARYWGLTPFGNEKTPSFSVSPEKGLYYCFSTSKGGTVFSFIMEMEKMSFLEAVEHVGKKVGVDVHASRNEDKNWLRRQDLLRIYDRVSGSFRHILLQSSMAANARRYLRDRGIEEQTLEHFGIGYAPPDPGWLHRFLNTKSYSNEFLSRSGLFSKKAPNQCLFVDRIMFPIRNRRGEIVAFGGRRMGDFGPKYINSPESPLFKKSATLYGFSTAREAIGTLGRFIVAEGYMDVLAIHQIKLYNVVGSLGTAFTTEQARLVRRSATVCDLLFDGDDAGMKAAIRAAMVMEVAGIEPFICPLPLGMDPASLVVSNDAESVHSLMERERKSVFDYLVGRMPDNDEKKARKFVFESIFPYINAIGSALKRAQYLNRIAEIVHVDRQAILDDFQMATRPPARRRSQPVSTEQSHAPLFRQELYLMIAAIAEGGRFRYLRSLLDLDRLSDPAARTIYIAAEECFRQGEESLESLLGRLEDEGVRSMIIKHLSTDVFQRFDNESILDIVNHITVRNLEKKEQEYIRELRRLPNNTMRELELQQEIMYLNAEVQKLKAGMHG